MADQFVSRGFVGRRQPPGDEASRIPPGQYLTRDFPVLSAGPTPRIELSDWSFTIEGLVGAPVTWSWDEFQALARQDWTVDISCVTKWTKLDTHWTGVSVDTLLERVNVDPAARFLVAHSYGGYTTNLPLEDVLSGQAFVAMPTTASRWSRPTAAGPAGGAAPVLLEEREMGSRAAPHGR